MTRALLAVVAVLLAACGGSSAPGDVGATIAAAGTTPQATSTTAAPATNPTSSSACPTGQTYCGTTIYTGRPPGCYDLMNTWDACGSCDGPPCRQSWDGSSHRPGRCDDGVCARTPPTCSTPGLTWCPASTAYPGRREPNGACVDLLTDVEDCGACDAWCYTQAKGVGTCQAGTCVWH